MLICKKKIIAFTLLFTLKGLFLLVVLWSMMIYTSLNKNLSWYDPCGMQFLAVLILSCPALIIIGCAQNFLCRSLNISSWSRRLPFVTCAGLALPILFDGGLGKIMQIIGTVICVTSIIAVIYLAVIDVKRIIRQLKITAAES